MVITQGKHKGETTEMVFFRDPYYVKLLLEYCNPDGLMPEIREEFGRLAELYDLRDLECNCSRCGEPADVVIIYKKTLLHEALCVECHTEVSAKKKSNITTRDKYLKCLDYAERYWPGSSEHYRMIIRNIAVLKGLPEAFSPEDVESFFAVCADIKNLEWQQEEEEEDN